MCDVDRVALTPATVAAVGVVTFRISVMKRIVYVPRSRAMP